MCDCKIEIYVQNFFLYFELMKNFRIGKVHFLCPPFITWAHEDFYEWTIAIYVPNFL